MEVQQVLEKNRAIETYKRTMSNLYEQLANTEESLNSLAESYAANIAKVADKITAHREAFNQNQADIAQKIADYRATLQA